MTEQRDIIIIGGGVVGCAIARQLSRYEGKTTLLEAGSDIADGATKANSAIVHGGYDATPGTLKAKLNVKGTAIYPELCQELGVPYRNNGSMVLCFREEDRPGVEKLYKQGIENGVPGMRIIEKDEILSMEPNVNPNVVCALLVTNSGITSPYELCFALADHAAVNGVEFRLNSRVEKVRKEKDGYRLELSNGDSFTAPVIVNCAGTNSACFHNMLSSHPCTIIPRKGEYYLMDHQLPSLFDHTLFQLPTAMGKGILVSPTVHGNLLLGPSAEDIGDADAKETTAEALKFVSDTARITWPKENLRTVITTFAGIRAHEKNGEFIIGAVDNAPGAYETVGIESPGLSAAPAIAEMLVDQIAAEQNLKLKAEWLSAPVREKPFYAMNMEERAKAVARDPEYGSLICRCEEVTEAEIRAAIRRPVGARTVDAVKRRTRAGMGRCQGGFCSPRVLEILSEELGVSPLEITKCGGESRLLIGKLMEKGE